MITAVLWHETMPTIQAKSHCLTYLALLVLNCALFSAQVIRHPGSSHGSLSGTSETSTQGWPDMMRHETIHGSLWAGTTTNDVHWVWRGIITNTFVFTVMLIATGYTVTQIQRSTAARFSLRSMFTLVSVSAILFALNRYELDLYLQWASNVSDASLWLHGASSDMPQSLHIILLSGIGCVVFMCIDGTAATLNMLRHVVPRTLPRQQ